MTTRRAFMAGSLRLGTGAALAASLRSVSAAFARVEPTADGPFENARRIGDAPFVVDRDRLERLTGHGLDGRYQIDLRRLTTDSLVIPNERFFIRTRAPDGVDLSDPWRLRLRGADGGTRELPAQEVIEAADHRGPHLLECSGNGRPFGLMSAAQWDGAGLASLLDAHGFRGERVLVSGADAHSNRSRRSTPGAAWVFTRAQLQETGAFLATRMNGAPLRPDHGFPVRLVVPGWYGCCCIKWIDEIRAVDHDEPATSQMREFASRTHQWGTPRLARAYRPAEIDLAAMPVRVERWRRADGTIAHHVVGIIWGGRRTTDRLMIRFGRGEKHRVDSLEHRTNGTWTLWSHVWRPTRAGRHRITMHVDNASIRTRRLDSGFYARTVRIDEV